MSPTPNSTPRPDFTNLKDALADTQTTSGMNKDNVVDTLIQKSKEKEGKDRQLKTNLNKWPSPVQDFIKTRMFNYVTQFSDKATSDDLAFINTFLDTALQDADYSDASAYPDSQWAESIRALAYQLRNYYGVEDTDDPLPCWWR